MFSKWLRQRRRALNLSPDALAALVGCAVVTLYKIEAGERKPSGQISALLAKHLNISPQDYPAFIAFARGEEKRPLPDSFWGTPFHPPTNLPSPPTPLIGRAQDVIYVRKRLLREDTQLLTLVGPPGIGKTRLSLAVASDVLDEFSDGVFVVLLAPITDPELVAGVIARTLGIAEVGTQPASQRLNTFLRDKQMLLLLDNFEQILPAAPTVAELLATCPFLKLLITSRAPLRIRRERQLPVPALALPDLNRLPQIDALPSYPAVELFIERAQAVKPDFSLTNETAQPIAAICNRLDGLPLAIELISARVKLLPPAALLERLHGRLMLQSDGLRDLEPRHRTLNAAIGWSYDLLDVNDKKLFTRLGVFAGGWTMEAAEAVCQPEGSIVDGMASLLDKCLVQQIGSSEPRFAMLETIREYALECLAQSGESHDLHRCHASYFLKLADTPAAEEDAWAYRIEQDYDNLRAALDWCFTSDQSTGMRLTLAISGYWLVHGHLVEGRFWFEKALKACHQEAGASPTLQRGLLSCAANLAHFQDDMPAMREYGESLLALGAEHQDQASTASACFFLGMDALHRQAFGQAESLFEQGLTLARQLDDRSSAGSLLLMLGGVAYHQKDYERAYSLYAEGVILHRQLENRFVEQMLLLSIGAVREEQGYFQEARSLYREGLLICRKLGYKLELSLALEYLGGLTSVEGGDHQRATRLLGAAEALRESILAPIQPLEQNRHDDLVALLRTYLDESTFTTAWAEGRLMTLEQAMEYALSD